MGKDDAFWREIARQEAFRRAVEEPMTELARKALRGEISLEEARAERKRLKAEKETKVP